MLAGSQSWEMTGNENEGSLLAEQSQNIQVFSNLRHIPLQMAHPVKRQVRVGARWYGVPCKLLLVCGRFLGGELSKTMTSSSEEGSCMILLAAVALRGGFAFESYK